MKDKLKSCPFCGGANLEVHQYVEDGRVECKDCQARGPWLGTESQISEAIEAWNRWTIRGAQLSTPF